MPDYAFNEGHSTTSKASKSMQALNTTHRRQETFFDDVTPVESKTRDGLDNNSDTHQDPMRDSHDLSFAEGANLRHSVVDNMLLSLDQFATGLMFGGSSGGADEDFFLKDSSYRAPGARHRGHTYTSSRSSDYDFHVDDSSSRYMAHHSRSRRSNSSNNIGGKASTRDAYSGRQTTGLYGSYQQTGHMRSGGGKKSSKGSGSSSMDFGQTGILGNQRLGFGKRSASFDHGTMGDRPRHSPVKVESVLDRGRVAYQNYHGDFDAAPEPTVPAGPRMMREAVPQLSATLPHQLSYAPLQAPIPRRRGSVHSNTSYRSLRKNKSELEPSMRAQAQEFVNASTLRDLTAVPTFQNAPAPAPTVATRKPLFPSQAPTTAPKEKQGFFRRVFGGGSSKVQPPPQPQAAPNIMSPPPVDSSLTSGTQRPLDIDSIYSHTRPRTTPTNINNHIATQLKPSSKPPQNAPAPQKDSRQPAPPVLTKKPSSFFRRRKKSISDSGKPPIMALDFTPPVKPAIPAQPSAEVGSLHEAMNSYLGNGTVQKALDYDSQEQQSGEDRMSGEQTKAFSPGSKPQTDSVACLMNPDVRGSDNTASSSKIEPVKNSNLASSDGPKLKLKMKHGKSTLANPHEDTFLADSSSCNEDRSDRATSMGESSSGVDEARRLCTCPTTSSFNQTETEEKSNLTTQLSPNNTNTSLAPDSGSTSQSASEAEDEEWIITVAKAEQSSLHPSASSKRVWLDTTSAEDRIGYRPESLSLPLEGARSSQQSFDKLSPTSLAAVSPTSPGDVFHSATSLPIVQVESRESDTMSAIIEDRSTHSEPTDADRERAFKIFSGTDSPLLKAQAAASLGDVTLTSTRMRKAFMDLFDWSGFSILNAMRDLCSKIVLKAETQQVDRILMSLSERWCECNSNHGFKAVDVVHTICYSILLLNTDLHLADIDSRMTRSQFVRNTLPTVTRVCQDSVKAAGDETLRSQSTQFRRGSIPWIDKSEPASPLGETSVYSADLLEESFEGRRARSRLSARPPVRSGSEGMLSDSAITEASTLVNSPYNGPMKGWEFQVEMVLKDFYESIRKQPLPLHGASSLGIHEQPSSNNLSVGSMLRRTPSVLSKAPSDSMSYRQRSQGDFRSMGNRWVGKNKSRQRLYPSSTVASSRTSLDDLSVWSPAGSSSWSRYSYGKAATTMSMDSIGTHFAASDYQQAIGFANALSQAIIREEGMTISSDEDFARVVPLLEDETLELVGAPWAKEGILKHKHHLESVDKKAKDRAWSECFAVVEKGYMRLFSFSMNSKSVRNKSKFRPSAGGVVGGGNWMDNAEALDIFPLRQTIASALPPPGYSKTRPHVWALSLPTGAVHLFQVGTPDIVREFVSTANYWSARLSKEPLTGGVSSMEYGWGENVINPALIRRDSTPSVQSHMPRPSVASSLRSSMDHATGTPKPRLPGDKVVLSDWSPPTSSMMASNLMEVDQLRALTDYVKNIEAELAHHNDLRAPMLITFSPRHPNAAKAMANWERKSQYLLREIVKFRTYIDTLTMAQNQKQKIYAEREALEEKELEANGDGDAARSLQLDHVDGAEEVPATSRPTTS